MAKIVHAGAAARPPKAAAEGKKATERMWDPKTDRLAYAAGDVIPDDDSRTLVPDSERRSR